MAFRLYESPSGEELTGEVGRTIVWSASLGWVPAVLPTPTVQPRFFESASTSGVTLTPGDPDQLIVGEFEVTDIDPAKLYRLFGQCTALVSPSSESASITLTVDISTDAGGSWVTFAQNAGLLVLGTNPQTAWAIFPLGLIPIPVTPGQTIKVRMQARCNSASDPGATVLIGTYGSFADAPASYVDVWEQLP